MSTQSWRHPPKRNSHILSITSNLWLNLRQWFSQSATRRHREKKKKEKEKRKRAERTTDFPERCGERTGYQGSGRGPAVLGATPGWCNLLFAPLHAVKRLQPDGSWNAEKSHPSLLTWTSGWTDTAESFCHQNQPHRTLKKIKETLGWHTSLWNRTCVFATFSTFLWLISNMCSNCVLKYGEPKGPKTHGYLIHQ